MIYPEEIRTFHRENLTGGLEEGPWRGPGWIQRGEEGGSEFEPAEGQTAPNPLPPLPWRPSSSPLLPQEGTQADSGEGLFPHPSSPPMTNALQFGHLHRARGPQSKLPHTRVSSLILS